MTWKCRFRLSTVDAFLAASVHCRADFRSQVLMMRRSFSLVTSACLLNLLSYLAPLHFRSQERKVHTENFRSRGTFVLRERTFPELSFL